jgi:hypothetical protein
MSINELASSQRRIREVGLSLRRRVIRCNGSDRINCVGPFSIQEVKDKRTHEDG